MGSEISKRGESQISLIASLTLLLLLSLLLGSFCLSRWIDFMQSSSQRYQICKIFQQSLGSDLLKSDYLAEVLGLSEDASPTIAQFDTKKAEQLLLGLPILKEVAVHKLKPDALLVQYLLRPPVAQLEDYSNTLIDAEGVLLPSSPFYTPKHLSTLYFGLSPIPEGEKIWGKRLPAKSIECALQILGALNEVLDSQDALLRLDLSKLEATSLGQQEVVCLLKNGLFLRLTKKNYLKELSHYATLKRSSLTSIEEKRVIDLRIADVAYIY